MVKIIIHGLGAMGKVVANLLEKEENAKIVAGITSRTENLPDYHFPIYTNIFECQEKADVIIDFSSYTAVKDLVKFGEIKKMPLVICTTGLDEDTNFIIQNASKKIPIFKSANMSFGISLLTEIIENYSKILFDHGFDIEILEKHHQKKIDAPSGTALYLAEAVKNSVPFDLEYASNRNKKRNKTEIGIQSIRGGTIVGEHSIFYCGQEEEIEIKHQAFSKEIFGKGAVSAAFFLWDQKPGFYTMKNLINHKK